MKGDSIISLPPTPNSSSISSQSNVNTTSSPNTTPSITTPTQLGDTNTSIGCESGQHQHTSGHKNSLKGTKLARRARSFKDDIFERLSQMRTPTRSNSPSSPRSKNAKPLTMAESVANSAKSLDFFVKDITNALKHFRDVVIKEKYEVLPGNGTVILETIAKMFTVIQSYSLNGNGTVLLSATQRVYQSLGKLIKLCDDVMLWVKETEKRATAEAKDDVTNTALCKEEQKCPFLSQDTVKEIVNMLEEAVKSLVELVQQKLKEKRENVQKYEANNLDPYASSSPSPNHLMRPAVEVPGQRISLPDITLTPKERDILQKKNSNPIHNAHSTESILRDSSPPPKPPLPNKLGNPPPLPPKRRHQQTNMENSNNISFNSDLDCSSEFSLMNFGVDHLSIRSRSPDGNSSQCSLDSALNHSREEDEIKSFEVGKRIDENLLEDNVEKMSSRFVSMKSCRSSSQSVCKRLSDFSIQSSGKSSNNSEIAISTFDGVNGSGEFQFQQHQQMQQHFQETITTKTCESNTIEDFSSTKKIYTSTTSSSTSSIAADGNNVMGSFAGSDNIVSQTVSSSTSMSATLLKTNSLDMPPIATFDEITTLKTPPALPPKKRHQTQFDTFDEVDDSCEIPELRSHHYQHQQHSVSQWQTKHRSMLEAPRRPLTVGGPGSFGITASCNTVLIDDCSGETPPPLPMKNKHILAYMEICTPTTSQHRHTMHACNTIRNISHSQTMNIVVPVSNEMTITQESELQFEQMKTPPALPPKNYKVRKPSIVPPTIITTPPPSPKPVSLSADTTVNCTNSPRSGRFTSYIPNSDTLITVNEELNDLNKEDQTDLKYSYQLPNVIDRSNENHTQTEEDDEGIDMERNKEEKLPLLLEELDITPYLVFKKDSEDGPEIKGGYIDALVVHASQVNDNAFSEAFITTFRTFIEPLEVIEKLTHRYTVFFCQLNAQKQKAAFQAFSLLVRVVNDLTPTDLTDELIKLLLEFVYQLVCSGNLSLVKLLRNTYIKKVNFCKIMLPFNAMIDEVDHSKISGNIQLHHTSATTKLLDLKSIDIAEQMTLLDAELFQKIEIPEVLLFAKEQCEEKSPNLKKFTEHFNTMSWWARSMILNLNDAKDREKHMIKFIKIMKHLRKINNFNSYLALLSALVSAPITRLEWHKTITDSLREYDTLIDSSSSFRVYRQTLAETSPPCIPYIGLILQDLTFVNVGNPDYLREGVINFSKRWQQHNIIENMKRFKEGFSYSYQRNERVIEFFDHFKNFLSEDELWMKSERIKPRAKRQN